MDSLEAREVLKPVRAPDDFDAVMEWLTADDKDSKDISIYAVGLGNWDAYWIPERTGMKLIDGWYDEGARDWRAIREIRNMVWTDDIDPVRFHSIVQEQGGDYIVVFYWDPYEAAEPVARALTTRPDLFVLEREWPRAQVFRPRSD